MITVLASIQPAFTLLIYVFRCATNYKIAVFIKLHYQYSLNSEYNNYYFSMEASLLKQTSFVSQIFTKILIKY